MSKFEYFHVFETIFYGLMLAKLVIGINNMFTYRKTIKFYWPYVLMIIYIFLVIINSYHDNLNTPVYGAVTNESFFLGVIILPPLLLYSIVHQGLPKKFKGMDQREFLLIKNRRIIFSLGFILGILGMYRLVLGWGLEKNESLIEIYIQTFADAWFLIPHALILMNLANAIWKNEILLKVVIVFALLTQILFYII